MSEIKNAKIIQTHLGYEDHGIPTCNLVLDYGGSQQAFGGYDLRYHGFEMIQKILDVVGVDCWEKLSGTHCRAQQTHTKVEAIGHLLEERWYNPTDESESKP